MSPTRSPTKLDNPHTPSPGATPDSRGSTTPGSTFADESHSKIRELASSYDIAAWGGHFEAGREAESSAVGVGVGVGVGERLAPPLGTASKRMREKIEKVRAAGGRGRRAGGKTGGGEEGRWGNTGGGEEGRWGREGLASDRLRVT